jgi:hypothetical protein
MDINTREVKEVEVAIREAAQSEVRDLADLQLALVGGGIAEVILG